MTRRACCYVHVPTWADLREQWYRAVRSGDKSDLARRLPALTAPDDERTRKSQPKLPGTEAER